MHHALTMPAPGHINALGTATKHLDANGKFLAVGSGPLFSQSFWQQIKQPQRRRYHCSESPTSVGI